MYIFLLAILCYLYCWRIQEARLSQRYRARDALCPVKSGLVFVKFNRSEDICTNTAEQQRAVEVEKDSNGSYHVVKHRPAFD